MRYILPVLLLIFFSELASGQTNELIYNSNVDEVIKNGNRTIIHQGDKEFQVYNSFSPTIKNGNDSIIKVIIEFKGDPLVKGYTSEKANFDSILIVQKEVLKRFEYDISNIYKKLPKSGKSKYKAMHNFNNSIFGLSAEVRSDAINGIKSLEYVKKVSISKKVFANLNESIPIIGADRVWSELGVKGEGIIIGILDTGVDYENENLGGGFGEGHKVIDGYDFVNDDNDPMDDHMHGTHVAGIAAGEGIDITGVAPKANIIAYKVLDNEGEGYSDDIIMAIEKCIDPNGDGDFSDRVDIVNMSLGGSGSYNDPKCIAIDNASEFGIVFCIAAGNEGEEGSLTIESPGTALKAITVGATDKNDIIADFSSIGPNNGAYNMKPEIVAPGVNILSCVLEDQIEAHKGTSMATPHISGVCALLKEIYPDWGYEEMKSALMSTATNLDENPMKQGAGRVNAFEASQVSSLLNPSSVNLGFLDKDSGIYEMSDTILITNISVTELDYSLNFNSEINGVELSVEPSTFYLSPSESISVVISIDIDVETLPESFNELTCIYGTGSLINQNEILSIPWYVLKGIILTLITDGNQFNGAIVNEDYHRSLHTFIIYADSEDTLYREEFIPNDIYDIFIKIDDDKFFTFQDKQLNNIDTLFLFSNKLHKVKLETFDENGELFTTSFRKRLMISFCHVNFGQFFVDLPYKKSLYFNNTGSKKLLFYNLLSENIYRNTIYTRQEPIVNISNDTILQNNPSEYFKKEIEINYPGDYSINFLFSTTTFSHGSASELFSYLDQNWKGTLYFQKYNHFDYSLFTTSFVLKNSDGWKCSTKPIWVYNDSIASYWNILKNPEVDRIYLFGKYTPSIYRSSIDNGLIFEDGPKYIFMNTYNNFELSGEIFIEVNALRQLNESNGWYEPISWKLYNSYNSEIASGEGWLNDTVVDLGTYTVVYDTKSKIDFVIGKHIIESTFDLRKEDPNPPKITSFQVRNSEDIPINTIKNGEDVSIYFSIADFNPEIIIEDSNENGIFKYNELPLDSLKIFAKESEDSQWYNLDYNFLLEDSVIGYYFKADLSDFTKTDSAFIDFKICFHDLAMNYTEAKWEPCFKVGKSEIPVATDDYFIVPPATWWKSDSLGVLKNDLNPNSDVSELTINLIEDVKHGTLRFIDLFMFKYASYPGYFESDTFSYSVSNSIYTSDTVIVVLDIDSTYTNIWNSRRQLVNEFSSYPNPFSDNSIAEFNIDKRQFVELKVFNINGEVLKTIFSGILPFGKHQFYWNAKNDNGKIIPSGIYFYQLKRSDHVQVIKAVYLP